MNNSDSWMDLLTALYGTNAAGGVHAALLSLLRAYAARQEKPGMRLDHRDAMLITYGDQLRRAGESPLTSLAGFARAHLAGVVTSIHLLPFYPYSSDDGFSVIDYRAVDPTLGDWPDIQRLRLDFRLMFDGVINHASAKSAWFRGFLDDDPAFLEYFIAVTGSPDLSKVVRPRVLPLLTSFGDRQVWTTFSADQVDLNYKNPQVLLEMIDLLLFYTVRGATFIRLDAIAYLWKEFGTSCIHLPQTHAVVQLLRSVLDEIAPGTILITETNVPHTENISYFGDGHNEAGLVYNFALPPLVLHTLHTANAGALSTWAANLKLPSDQVTFFNFLASHDGIGITPVRGILTQNEVDAIIERVRLHGGLVSARRNPDGSQSPYELNINYFDALSNPAGSEPLEMAVDRFVAAHAIMLCLVGMPGIYFHSLFGSRGWKEGVALSGANRSINRQKFARETLERELAQPGSLRSRVFSRLRHLLEIRASQAAFDPYGTQQILDVGKSSFAVLRTSPGAAAPVLCLQNVSDKPQTITLDGIHIFGSATLVELVSGITFTKIGSLTLGAYQTMWFSLPFESDGS